MFARHVNADVLRQRACGLTRGGEEGGEVVRAWIITDRIHATRHR